MDGYFGKGSQVVIMLSNDLFMFEHNSLEQLTDLTEEFRSQKIISIIWLDLARSGDPFTLMRVLGVGQVKIILSSQNVSNFGCH